MTSHEVFVGVLHGNPPRQERPWTFNDLWDYNPAGRRQLARRWRQAGKSGWEGRHRNRPLCVGPDSRPPCKPVMPGVGWPVIVDGQAHLPAERPGLDHLPEGLRRGRRTDAGNHYPPIKAVLDGFVDAGAFPDDGPDYIASLVLRAPIWTHGRVGLLLKFWPGNFVLAAP